MTKHDLPALERRGIPTRTSRATLAAVATDATAAVEIKGSCDLLVLSGLPGRGKSVAACQWLISSAREKPECMRWIQAGDLARGYAYDREAFRGLARVYALVIDDLGVEYLDQKDRYVATLEELLSVRYARERKTCLTTNCTPDEFRARYGERIVSRINEDGAFLVCSGPDLRRAGVRAA